MGPFNPGYYETVELRALGMSVGENVMIAKNCTIIGLGNSSFGNIIIGDNVRIDGFTTIAAASGHLSLGSHSHIGGYCFLLCTGGVTLEDFSALSQRVSIYSASDDYTGSTIGNPTIHAEYRCPEVAAVHLGRHVIVGSAAVILPGVTIGDGSAVGALSLVPKSLTEWGIFCGTPARKVDARSKAVLEQEKAFLDARA